MSAGLEEAHREFPVGVGEVWRVGPHLVACGDLVENGHAFLAQAKAEMPVGMVYNDPPWNAGIMKRFCEMAGHPTGEVDFPDFIGSVCRLLAAVGGDVYLEMGDRGTALTKQGLEAAGLRIQQDWKITYSRGKIPCRLVLASRRRDEGGPLPPGLDSADAPLWAICRSARMGEAVFDPCLGLGTTLVGAHRADRPCVGMELNPKRLAWAISRVASVVKGRVECVGHIGG